MSDPYAAHILIVDDEPANVLFLERLLGRAGYTQVSSTTDSREVAYRVRQRPPDLILLDLHMPHLTGFDLLEQLRPMMSEDRFLPVIVLTADATAHTKKRALEARAIDYLTKPLDAAEVLLRVRNHLRTRLLHVHMEAEVRRGIRELEQAQIEVLERLAHAAEFRDDDTGQHTYRVGEMASRLARALGFADEQAELIRRAAPLHDVGKIGIPDAVLLKPGRLTPEEMALMRKHATIGANLLSGGRSELMQMAEQIALTHHERWDGTGYPAGLRGDAIPLTGRIVAVTDVFDALSSDRPYRPAWPIERVREEITRGVGTHFDPQVATAFLQLEDV